jgi:ribosomal protein L11 methyltransferase
MATYPALDVSAGDVDRVLAVVDDYSPTAVEDHDGSFTLYFSSRAERDEAWRTLAREMPSSASLPREVDDEDWARRSQSGLAPVSVGRLTVSPPWLLPAVAAGSATIVITPSMGFGTGHHATTRLCLQALQTLDLSGRSVLDVGTGSGVLALAARRLGAQDAAGVDSDGDAVSAARENLALNPWSTDVRFDLADLWTDALATADVVTANLTGALLVRGSRILMDLVRPGGVLVVSGLLADEQSSVLDAFLGAGSAAPREEPPRLRADLRWSAEEDGWIGLVFNVGRDQPV